MLFPSLVAAVATKSNQPPTMPSFDPFKAYYPSNRTEILAARNITDAQLRLPKLAPNGTLINADLLGQYSGQESILQQVEHHEAFGTYLNYEEDSGTGQPMIMGLEVMCYVQPDLTLPEGALLYAPSSRAPDPNAFEVSTIYSYNSGSDTMDRQIGAWDWSIANNDHFNWVRTFEWLEQNNYFGTLYGMTYYNLVLAQDQYGDYALFLYDFDTELWDWQTASQDARDVDGYGQVYYEYIYWDDGPLIPTDIPYIEASNQMIYYLNGASYTWSLNYESLGLSSGTAWSDQWLDDRSIPHGWIDNNKYFYDWYVGT